jgi:small-conductance mechanosensitive channel/CRP-like cAMP-binding protein
MGMVVLAQSPTPEGDLLARGLEVTNLTFIYSVAAVAIYLVLVFVGRMLKRRYGVPLGWLYQIFAFAAALFIPVNFPGIDLEQWSIEDHLGAFFGLAAALVLVVFVRHYLFDILFRKQANTQVPKFASEIVSIVIVVAAVFVILQGVYHVEVPGLLAGAGIVGLVLGLALQDTLGNIFSGFAIYFGGQFKSGDWLLVGDHHAQIVEVNWRSTRLRTIDDVYLDIPNSNITKETVVNYNYPTDLHAMLLDIGLEYDAPPTKVREVLIEAALNCPDVLTKPKPNVYLKEFGDWAITYQLRFWLNDHSRFRDVYSDIKTYLWYALRRAKIAIPYPIQGEFSYQAPPAEEPGDDVIRAALKKVVFYECLTESQAAQLVRGAGMVSFGGGENIIRQGAQAGPMYILVSGKAEVLVESAGTLTQVAEIGPGDCIGEISVLTGDPRSATVRARGDCVAVEVDKATLAPIIEASPELLERLSDLLARRRLQNEGLLAEAGAATLTVRRHDYTETFLKKLRSFFEI